MRQTRCETRSCDAVTRDAKGRRSPRQRFFPANVRGVVPVSDFRFDSCGDLTVGATDATLSPLDLMPRPPSSISRLVAGAALGFVLRLVTLGATSDVVEIGSRLELFVDRYLIGTFEGAELRLHHPQPAGVALKF